MAIDESSKTKKLELCLLEQLFTNTGNQYDVIGRPITNILYYNYALKEKPHFPMALGNKGIALMSYADFLYDLGHKNILDHMAFQLLDAALQRKEYLVKHGPGCIKCFQQYKNQLEQAYSQQFLSSKLDLDGYTYGDSTDEIEYKFWVAQNTLFLNPLNDITDMTIAAEDIIHLPIMICLK